MLRTMVDSGDTQPLAPIHSHSSPLAPERVASRTAPIARNRRRSRVRRWVLAAVLSVIVMTVSIVGGVMAMIYVQARTDEARPVDAIVVMGAAQYNGRPSPVLEARLSHALNLYNDGLAPVIVVTGGKQPDDLFTEAEAGYAWLMEQGVPESAIVLENEGRSTWESIQGIPEVLPVESAERVLIVSDAFHLFRGELMMRSLDYDAYSSPARNSPIQAWSPTEFSYVVRETGGVLVFLPKMLLH